MAILFIDHRKAARVVPHGPADAVPFHRSSHVPNPKGAISRRRNFAICPEFITGKRDVIPCSPGGGRRNFLIDAGGIPTVLAIAPQTVTRRFILNRVENLVYAIRTRWVRNVFIEGRIRPSPSRALMRERERFVEMKVINDVSVGIGLYKQQLGKTGPPVA